MNRVALWVATSGMVVIVALALLTGLDVAGRYLFNSPLPGTFELTELMMALVVGSGIASTTARDEHISVDALYVKLSRTSRRFLLRLDCVIGILVFGVMTWKAMHTGLESLHYEEVTPLLHVPLHPVKFLLAAAFLISVVFLLYRLKEMSRDDQV